MYECMRHIQESSNFEGGAESHKGHSRLQDDVDKILHRHVHLFLKDKASSMGNQVVDIDIDVVLSEDDELIPSRHALGLTQVSGVTIHAGDIIRSGDHDEHDHEMDVRIYEGVKVRRPSFIRTRAMLRRLFTERLRYH
ncbi:MAG: hypothetical protein COZ49_03535 [Candidatus Yonathbacteria bacterium CG_4_10_14_3_um_filter_47_65]|uniref:Uncharacterized protein n=2 Tax=Parcubacteria group TaxID=1794811 RepID=A0A1J4VA68_9BACT|nr:MAG: hypothetical protein AUJ44_01385 [Candidatus Nomurabacteria bacterium CG1_02_47_685]PIP03471.1 MAG: hypothetical protein COX54_03450 [Candidatus Yonathbacteria bacterium CG23_combo_of_CG06-09_8_20_14_all_46_18]PIQ32964.1 MAG: hypothetical protein COW61_00640 [Candidatus Yonathbacteria bacterium CG17_big_fil_post_rev_8_21_14_2_50_46_19]PIX56185.1 MAG: hypothetical protein COZ49_03535 [Candidatus Yonathbacteria bacterium CG_4_10_14_3_um_filter_47_65]PIY57655.1 MAG: hypothetical protein CO